MNASLAWLWRGQSADQQGRKFSEKTLKPKTIRFMLPESFGRNLCSPDQGSQLCIGDVRIDGSKPGEGRETTVRACNHPFPPDDVGKTADAFCYQFGMFDKISRRIQYTGNQYLVLFNQSPICNILSTIGLYF